MRGSYPKLHSIRYKGRDNVEYLDIATPYDIDPNNVLMGAINAQMIEVVVIGYDSNGNEYFASSVADGAEVLWHLKRTEKKLMEF